MVNGKTNKMKVKGMVIKRERKNIEPIRKSIWSRGNQFSPDSKPNLLLKKLLIKSPVMAPKPKKNPILIVSFNE